MEVRNDPYSASHTNHLTALQQWMPQDIKLKPNYTQFWVGKATHRFSLQAAGAGRAVDLHGMKVG